MGNTDAFRTIRAARALTERHPDAPTSVATVALTLATFANGRTGTSIRPGFDRVAAITGLHEQTVKRAVAWLVERGELRRDNTARPGSAACFTWLGGMVVPETPPSDGMVVPDVPNGGASHTPHQPNQPTPSGLEGPRGGEASQPLEGCSMCGRQAKLDEALCRSCFDDWYGTERTWAG